MIKINNKIFCIPPYISTTWNTVSTLRKKNSDLLVTLFDGITIEIPNLTEEVTEKIFEMHVNSLEEENISSLTTPSILSQPSLSTPEGVKEGMLRFSIGGIGDFSSMKHNPELSDAPDIPEEILEKIVAITKKIVPIEALEMPKAEENCNCIHCQISRALNKAFFNEENQGVEEVIKEEIVYDSELSFNQWDVLQSGENLYSVVNKLDSKEQFAVFLGDPIGCTCGNRNCEHIEAALKT